MLQMPLRYKPAAPLRYEHCDQTVTVYHTTFNPFRCRRAVLEGVYWGHRKNWALQKTGEDKSNGLLLVIPQRSAARVSAAADPAIDGTYILEAGDRVVMGVGPEISTREEWAALLPSAAEVVTIGWVEQYYWHGEPCHVEAGV